MEHWPVAITIEVFSNGSIWSRRFTVVLYTSVGMAYTFYGRFTVIILVVTQLGGCLRDGGHIWSWAGGG